MRPLIAKLDWTDALLNVAYFLKLISEENLASICSDLYRWNNPDEALDFIIAHSPPERLTLLSIDRARLRKIAEVTNAFGEAGKKYEPEGLVQRLDVF